MTQQKALTDKEVINAIFKDLRKEGFKARQNYKCCQNCGWSAMSSEYNANGDTPAVFYHRQDTEALEGGKLKSTIYLAWQGDANKIVTVIIKHGMSVEWDGTKYGRIGIMPKAGYDECYKNN